MHRRWRMRHTGNVFHRSPLASLMGVATLHEHLDVTVDGICGNVDTAGLQMPHDDAGAERNGAGLEHAEDGFPIMITDLPLGPSDVLGGPSIGELFRPTTTRTDGQEESLGLDILALHEDLQPTAV